jgi:hypothetical protein
VERCPHMPTLWTHAPTPLTCMHLVLGRHGVSRAQTSMHREIIIPHV